MAISSTNSAPLYGAPSAAIPAKARSASRTRVCSISSGVKTGAGGATVKEAGDGAYAAIDRIDWPGGFHRTDIGWRALGAR